MTTEKKTAEITMPRFTKAQLMGSAKYSGRKDLISALLDDNAEYTAAQADDFIEKYLRGTVV